MASFPHLTATSLEKYFAKAPALVTGCLRFFKSAA